MQISLSRSPSRVRALSLSLCVCVLVCVFLFVFVFLFVCTCIFDTLVWPKSVVCVHLMCYTPWFADDTCVRTQMKPTDIKIVPSLASCDDEVRACACASASASVCVCVCVCVCVVMPMSNLFVV